jgi:hypothetical protein
MEEVEISIGELINNIEKANNDKHFEILDFIKTLNKSEIKEVGVLIKNGVCFKTTHSAYIIYKTKNFKGYQSSKEPIFNSIEFVFYNIGNYKVKYIYELKDSYCDVFHKSDFDFIGKGTLKYIDFVGNCNYTINKEPIVDSEVVFLNNASDWLKFDFNQIIEYPRGQILGEVKVKQSYHSTYFNLPIQSLFLESDLLENHFKKESYDKFTYSKRIMSLNNVHALIDTGSLYIQCLYVYYQGDNSRDGFAEFSIKTSELITIANTVYN